MFMYSLTAEDYQICKGKEKGKKNKTFFFFFFRAHYNLFVPFYSCCWLILSFWQHFIFRKDILKASLLPLQYTKLSLKRQICSPPHPLLP